MAVTAPEWLVRRGGSLRQGSDGWTWFVLLDGEPQYRITPMPAGGKHGCHVVQTISGKRLDRGGVYLTAEDAVRGGLEDLRQAVGW